MNDVRTTLRRQAAEISSTDPDPFASIERRATRLRRKRVAVTSGGTVLALGLIATAIAVPVLSDPGGAPTVRPPVAVSPSEAAPTPSVAAPANVLQWPSPVVTDRGLLQSATAFFTDQRHTKAVPETNVLAYDAQHGALLMQIWMPGDQEAATVGFLSMGEPQLKRPAVVGQNIVAMYIPGATTATEYLFVVGAPTTGQVLYAADGKTFKPVAGTNPVLISRDPKDMSSRVRVLDGDGKEIANSSVLQLLCGVSECG